MAEMTKQEFAARLLFWLLPWPISKALPRSLRIYYWGPSAVPPADWYYYWGQPFPPYPFPPGRDPSPPSPSRPVIPAPLFYEPFDNFTDNNWEIELGEHGDISIDEGHASMISSWEADESLLGCFAPDTIIEPFQVDLKIRMDSVEDGEFDFFIYTGVNLLELNFIPPTTIIAWTPEEEVITVDDFMNQDILWQVKMSADTFDLYRDGSLVQANIETDPNTELPRLIEMLVYSIMTAYVDYIVIKRI